jgi:inner membrane protein
LDNVTHTLIGFAAGELVARLTRSANGGLSAPVRRTALLCIGMIGGNLPDCDLLWSYAGDDASNLDYMLEHRGYTHTLVGCAVLAVLLFMAIQLWLRWRGHKSTPEDRGLLATFTAVSVLLHLGMDALNSYGVHPFWPWDNRWYYGDAVFIVEPLYWLAVAPLLLLQQAKSQRMVLGLLLLIANVALLTVHRFTLPWIAVPLLTALLVWSGKQLTPQRTAVLSATLLVGITGMFLAASHIASVRVQGIVQARYPGFTTVEQVLTPSLSQPLCWDVLVLQRNQDEYAARSGQLSLTNDHAVDVCPQVSFGPPAANAATLTMPTNEAVRWESSYTASLAQLNTLVAKDCYARAALQFIRAPMLLPTQNGWVLSDLRFNRGGGFGLGTVMLGDHSQAECSHQVPWLPPRGELLNAVQ